jgi:hypothetical protein
MHTQYRIQAGKKKNREEASTIINTSIKKELTRKCRKVTTSPNFCSAARINLLSAILRGRGFVIIWTCLVRLRFPAVVTAERRADVDLKRNMVVVVQPPGE